MAEFPRHLEHITKLTEEEAKALNFKERYRHMADMDEAAMLAEIDHLFLTRNDTEETKDDDNKGKGVSNQERSSSDSDYRTLSMSEVEDMKDLYSAFKYRNPAYAPTFDEVTTGRMMDPPLFKPRYPPAPGPNQVSGEGERNANRLLPVPSVSQQVEQVERADNKSSDAGTDIATPAAPRSEQSSDHDAGIDEKNELDPSEVTPVSIPYNRMKSFFDRWVAKDIAGEDKIEADEKNSDVGNDKGTEQGDEGRSGAATDKPAHQEETKTASIDPKVSAKGKEKRTSSPPDIGKQTATQRKAAKKQAKRAIKSAVPESTTEAKAAAPSPENEEDTSGRNTTWVVNLPRNDADTEESRQEKVRAIMALITGKEKSQVESRAPSATRERGTILGEIIEEDEESKDEGSKKTPADVPPPVKSMSKKARNKALKEAKKKGGK